jgi:hypothetical protein
MLALQLRTALPHRITRDDGLMVTAGHLLVTSAGGGGGGGRGSHAGCGSGDRRGLAVGVWPGNASRVAARDDALLRGSEMTDNITTQLE